MRRHLFEIHWANKFDLFCVFTKTLKAVHGEILLIFLVIGSIVKFGKKTP